MNNQNKLRRAMDSILPGMEQNTGFEQRVLRRIHEQPAPRRGISKRAVTAVLIGIMLLLSATAMAAVLLSGREVVDDYAVPMAISNDTETYTQGAYTHEELARLIRTLKENGITLDEESTIMEAFQSGHGYWEEDVIQAICEEALDGRHYAWSVEEKYWYDALLVRIGVKERNWYLLPGEGDMTVPEARAYAAELLNAEYGLSLPAQSNEAWLVCEYFFAADSISPPMWRFDFVSRAAGSIEYGVSFDREGNVILIENVGEIQSVTETPSAQEPTAEDPARWAEKDLQQEAYAAYQQTYGEISWWFWPLEAQKEAMGGNHHIPEGEEMTCDEAITHALDAIREQYGADALSRLGEYQAGAICKRYQGENGFRIAWCIYITSDPVYVSNGFRVEFDDPCGVQKQEGTQVMPVNAENG